MHLLSAFSSVVWIPIAIFALSVYAALRGVRSMKSNSTQQVGLQTNDNTGNVSFLQTGGGKFSVFLFIVSILVFLVMYWER